MIKTLFDGGEIPKERIGYTCLACISIDSVLKVDKKWFPQVYLEQCKYKVRINLIDYELGSDYESD